jgi:DNA invertase Pin-like site-specific DNA recombinase
MKAAIYLRVSTDRQEASIAQQAGEVQKWAAEHGYEVVAAYYDNGVSGSTADRPGFRALFEDAERGVDWETVIVYDRSRWGRFENVEESIGREFILRSRGKRLKCVQREDVPGLIGALMKLMDDWKAGEERKDILTRMQRGRVYNTASGWWVKGRPPYGYRLERVRDGKQTRSKLVLGPVREVMAVKRIYRERGIGVSLRGIVKQLECFEDPAPAGGKWNAEAVRQILNNPVYKGRLTFNGEKWEGSAIEGRCPAIIEEPVNE